MTFLYDVVNLEYVMIIYFVVVYYLRLDVLRSFLVLGHLIVIFLLNDVLFDPKYWADQYQYFWNSRGIRTNFISNLGINSEAPPLSVFFWLSDRMLIPSILFASSPIPFINSLQSIAMINFLLYLFSFIFLRGKKVFSNNVDFFFLLYPSFLLYSSLALRETQIVLFMILSLYFILVEEKKLLAFIVLLPLAFIKIQNFLIIMLSYVIYMFLAKGSIQRYLIFFGICLIVIFFGDNVPLVNLLFDKINYYRYNLIAENFGYDWSFMGSYDYQPFEIGFQMIPLILKSFIYMLFKPFPWEVTNPVQLIQSIENIFIIGLIVWIVKKNVFTLIVKRKLLFLNILLIVSMTIYGLVTFNFGTAARFRFPFIVVYLIFYFYFLQIDKVISRQLSTGYSYMSTRL